jgi:hypothetical protein
MYAMESSESPSPFGVALRTKAIPTMERNTRAMREARRGGIENINLLLDHW